MYSGSGLDIGSGRIPAKGMLGSPTVTWVKILTCLECAGLISGSNWIGRVLAVICSAVQIGK